jgi:hypothetical protein
VNAAEGFVFPEPTLREAMAAMWAAAADAPDRPWTSFDEAVSECEEPEVVHPRFDDPDHAAMYAYRDEVSSA